MATLSVEPDVFWTRLVRLRDEWVRHRETEALWHKADAISVATGARTSPAKAGKEDDAARDSEPGLGGISAWRAKTSPAPTSLYTKDSPGRVRV